MPFELLVPAAYRGWKVKIREKERNEEPHVHVLFKTRGFRISLRTRSEATLTRKTRSAALATRAKDPSALLLASSEDELSRLVVSLASSDAGPYRAGLLVLGRTRERNLLSAARALLPKVISDHDVHLPEDELREVFGSEDAQDRFVAGSVNQRARLLVLVRGDLSTLVVPLTDFKTSGDGIEPNFARFSITDYGGTVRFGRYEAAADAILFERDADFRRRLRARRVWEEQSFGASLKRLRLMRGLTQDDFGEIDRRTIQRLESGATAKPQAETLAKLAKVLKVKPQQIEEY